MKGLEWIAGKLDAHCARISENALRARDECAQAAKTQARENAPVRTGRLRDSILCTEGRVYTALSYAAHVEWGARHTPPRPFLSAAADMPSYLRTAEQYLKEAVL